MRQIELAEEEEVEPLLPTPPPRCPRDVEQDPYMAGLGAQLTEVDLNNMNCINDDEETVGDRTNAKLRSPGDGLRGGVVP